MANQYEQDQSRQQDQGSKEQNRNQGNFKNDPERAREAGRKGGQSSRSGRSE